MEWLPTNKALALQANDQSEFSVQEQLAQLKVQMEKVQANEASCTKKLDKCLDHQETILAMLQKQQFKEQLKEQQPIARVRAGSGNGSGHSPRHQSPRIQHQSLASRRSSLQSK